MASQKTLTVPGAYDVVFENCILALRSIGVRVRSADKSTGVISGRRGSIWTIRTRMDVAIQYSPGQCIVTAQSQLRQFAATDWGINGRNVDRFFEVLLARVVPLAANPYAAAQAVLPGSNQLPSGQISSAPLRRSLGETNGGKTTYAIVLFSILFLMLCLIAVFISYASANAGLPH